ncbi:RNA polymerase factor sigma-54 [Shimazuella sp. AN120528]|uniref:RNA polymerase factor sigma-54 n=1 Tax=Shimazuella soli TaxID=1892854 RepID=UPI001F0D6F34|nr:RNA polymerase factor sigma-54 [Shimazuella soli]MCH5584877.1 RNA polymerase factor sigma-54 [Shimazuella soli]
MSLHIGYQLKQQQQTKLAITPEMYQAIKILQLSTEELADYIQEQVMENPILETEETNPIKIDKIEAWLKHITSGNRRKAEILHHDHADPTWENSAYQQKSLSEHLEEQLMFHTLSEWEKEICLSLIGSLNDQGYLDLDIPFFCKRFQINAQLLENCLFLIQSLDPIGVGSRTLAEYLEIQLRNQKPCNLLAVEIVKHFLPEVADGKWKKIASLLKVDLLEVQRAVDRIKQCNPRPNTFYQTTPTPYIYPDVIIQSVDNTFQIQINSAAAPKIQLNKAYLGWIKHPPADPAVNQYLKNHYHSALWLIKGIEQREQTIYRITEAILLRQKDFFQYGISYLKPLTLKQISADINLHESTVSRATQNKYIQTPHGLYSFRFFFPSGLDEELASHTVKNKLQQLIEQEEKTSPLSDQKLADLLKEEGIPISRRTVTKYRKKMGIASSASRKRYAVSN